MKISRHGATAFHGLKHINADFNEIRVDTENNCLEIKSNYVRDFNRGSNHNYTFKISFDEFRRIINEIAKSASKNPGELEKELSQITNDTLIILNVGSGSYRISSQPKETE